MVKPLPTSKYFGLFSFLWLAVMAVQAEVRIFSPAGSTGFWSQPAHWVPFGVPGSGDEVVISGLKVCTLDQGFSLAGKLTVETGATLLVREGMTFLPGSRLDVKLGGLLDTREQTLVILGNPVFSSAFTPDPLTDLVLDGCSGDAPFSGLLNIRKLRMTGGAQSRFPGGLRLSGDLDVESNCVLEIGSQFENPGPIRLQGTLRLSGPVQVSPAIQISGGSGRLETNGLLNGSPGVRLSFTGDGSPIIYPEKPLVLEQLVVNKTSGSVSLSGMASLQISDQISILAGTLDLGGNPVTLLSGPLRTARIGSISGTLLGSDNITFQRYINGNTQGWYFIGTPIQGQSFFDWSDDTEIRGPFPGAGVPSGPERSTVFVFDGASPSNGQYEGEVNGWRVPVGGSVSPGKGYRVFLRSGFFSGPRILDNTGDIVQGSFDFQPTFNPIGFGGGGWNFLANPYPSQIDWDSPAWVRHNIGNSLYIWNGETGQYGVYNYADDGSEVLAGTNGVTNRIASGQAFFVKATGPDPVLLANEWVKSSATASLVRKASVISSLMRITLANSAGYSDESILRFHAFGKTTFEPERDALKLQGSVLNLSTFSEEGSRLSINTLPLIPDEGQVVNLSVSSFGSGPMELRFFGFGEEANHARIRLYDRFLDTWTSISEGTVYGFSLNSNPESRAEGRFRIFLSRMEEFEAPIKITKPTLRVFQKAGSPHTLVLKLENMESLKPCKGALQLTDVQGRILFRATLDHSELSEFSFPVHLQNGVYSVNWQVEGQNLHKRTAISP